MAPKPGAVAFVVCPFDPRIGMAFSSSAPGLRFSRRNPFCAVALTVVLAACASPEPAAFAVDDAPARLDARPADVAAAFARANAGESLAIDADLARDPARIEHWRAAAIAFGPRPRAARAALRAAAAEARSGGVPDGVGVEVMDEELGGGADLVEMGFLVDGFALLGLGASGAERDVAQRALALALARYRQELFDAAIGVERVRIELGAARARRAAIDALRPDVDRLHGRIAVLYGAGRMGTVERDAAEAARVAWERAYANARADEARALEQLSALSGLPSGAPAFERIAPDVVLEHVGDAPDFESAGGGEHPLLAVARFELELAEAHARAAAAAAWPSLELGPQLSIEDGTRVGGLVNLRVPWPKRWRAELAAAEAHRDRALEVYEEALHGLREARVRARTAHRAATRRADVSGALISAGEANFALTFARWTGTLEGGDGADGASGASAPVVAMTQRVEDLERALDDQRDRALAVLDAAHAAGVLTGGDAAQESLAVREINAEAGQ